MQFSKYYQPNNRRGGRKPSAATIAKREAEASERQRKEQAAFEEFEAAREGYFNGFEMANVFHQHYDKGSAIFMDESDDKSEVETPFGIFNTGADGVMAYFFSEHPTKRVEFNRSVYFI